MAEKFGPIAKGIVQRRERDDRRVVGFPGKQWREERLKIVNSTDPVDVGTAYDPKTLHREVDRRVDAKNANGESRDGIFNKAATFLGLKAED